MVQMAGSGQSAQVVTAGTAKVVLTVTTILTPGRLPEGRGARDDIVRQRPSFFGIHCLWRLTRYPPDWETYLAPVPEGRVRMGQFRVFAKRWDVYTKLRPGPSRALMPFGRDADVFASRLRDSRMATSVGSTMFFD